MRYFLKVAAALAVAAVLGIALPALLLILWLGDPTDCVSNPDGIDIAACTRLIESRWVSTNDQAVSYYTRGIAYERKKQYARAIADYRAALRLKPSLKAARDGLKRYGMTE